MKKGLSILLALVFLFTAVIGASGAAVYAAEDEDRIAGDDRYETAAEIAKTKYTSADTVIIVRGDDNEKNEPEVVDGLTASVLAGAKNAPILLTRQNALPDATKEAIEALGAKNAYIVGGTVAVSEDVKKALEDLGVAVKRVEGADRFATAVEVAKEANTGAKTAIITEGFALADSLVAGPLAYVKGYPILLVRENEVVEATEKAIKDLGIENIIIVGGEAVVSKEVERALDELITGSVKRLGGDTRRETSVEVAKELGGSEVALVNGWSFVDAVSASVLGLPIVYVKQNELGEAVEEYLAEMGGVKVIGGEVAISDDVANKAKELVKFEVVSVSALGDNKIVVAFSGPVSDKVGANNFAVENRTINNVEVVGNTVILTLNSVMVDGTSYKVTVKDVANAAGTKKVDEYTYTLKYEFASVKEITLSKTTFRANVGEFVTNYVVVKDENGTILTEEDYQVTKVESKNENVVSNKGEVLNPGETEVRFKVEHKNGEVKWSDWIAVKSEGVTLEDNIAWAFIKGSPADNKPADNKKVFSGGQNWIYNDGEEWKLVVYRDYANGDTIGRHIDLRKDGMDKAKVIIPENTAKMVSITPNNDGTLKVKALENGATGTASITIEYELEGKVYKNTITFQVKAAPVLSGIKSFSKQTLLRNDKAGAPDGAYTKVDEIVARFGEVGEEGIDYVTFDLAKIFVDQYGNDYELATFPSSSETDDKDGDKNTEVWTFEGENDKMIVSIPGNVDDAINVEVNGSTLKVKAGNKPVSQFYITITYYEDKSSNTKSYETKIPVEVKDTDGRIVSYRITASASAMDAAKDEKVTFTVSALDKNGNVLTKQVTKLATIDEDEKSPLPNAVKKYVKFNEKASDGIEFVNNAAIYYAGGDTAKVKVEVKDQGTVIAKDVLSIALTNSNPVPVKAVLNDSITIDLSEALKAKKEVDPAATEVKLGDVLFGVINPKEMDADEYEGLEKRAENSVVYYGVKAGCDGYAAGLAPALKLYDKNNNLVPTKPFEYGNSAEDLTKVDTLYYGDEEVAVKIAGVAANVDSTVQEIGEQVDETTALKLEPNAQKGSFTLIIKKVTIKAAADSEGVNILGDKTITIRVNLIK